MCLYSATTCIHTFHYIQYHNLVVMLIKCVLYYFAVTPDVEVVATRTKVGLNASTTLHCITIRTNPRIETYIWMHEDTSITLDGSTSTLDVTFSTERHFGTISCVAINGAGKSGSADVTIERGCK